MGRHTRTRTYTPTGYEHARTSHILTVTGHLVVVLGVAGFLLFACTGLVIPPALIVWWGVFAAAVYGFAGIARFRAWRNRR